jgi:hypothetical protein
LCQRLLPFFFPWYSLVRLSYFNILLKWPGQSVI